MNQLEKNIGDILTHSFNHSDQQKSLIVSDSQSELAKTLTTAYRACLPSAQFIDFDSTQPETILAAFENYQAGDLVILIQSTSFRLNEFRIRVELFKRGLKVIEHPHLGRMTGKEAEYYIDALAYDPDYYRKVGRALKSKVDQCSVAIVDSGGEKLVYEGGLESAKLNIGDYSDMPNIGGQFPIGEVFTEAKDLEKVNGSVRIFAFGDGQFKVHVPPTPITLVIEKGQIIDTKNSTPDFDNILSQIQERDKALWVRELGFGMNQSFTKDRIVSDIGTYERMCGIHLSLGNKHAIYKKPNFKQRTPGFHLDVFAVTENVTLDNQIIYQNGSWIV
jgi:aminopeptidase